MYQVTPTVLKLLNLKIFEFQFKRRVYLISKASLEFCKNPCAWLGSHIRWNMSMLIFRDFTNVQMDFWKKILSVHLNEFHLELLLSPFLFLLQNFHDAKMLAKISTYLKLGFWQLAPAQENLVLRFRGCREEGGVLSS